jgi:peptide/nickel transport system ATP-binding protein
MIFVSHNLGLILETCDKITVMYSGEAVETGSIRDVFDRMRHPIRKACSARSHCRRGQEFAPAVAIPGQLPLPQAAEGLQLRPALPPLRRGLCNAAEIPMIPVEGTTAITAAASASMRSTGTRCRPARQEA